MYLSSIGSSLLLYDVNGWDLKKSYGCYEGLLRDISWSDDSKYMLQINAKGLMEILSSSDHDVRSLQHIPLKDTWSGSFHREGHRNIGIGTKSGNVMIWDTKNKTIVKTFPTPPQQSCVNHVSFNSKNTSLAATMQNGETIIYGLVSNIPVLTVKLHCSKSISAMKFHHDSRSLLGLATDEGHLVIRDISTNKDKIFFENIHASPVSDFCYSQVNKDVMFSCGYDKNMHVYDVRLQNVVSTIRTSHTLTSVSINTDYFIALGSKNGTVLIYDLRDVTSPFKVLKGQEEEVRRVAFQPSKVKPYSNDVSLRDTETAASPKNQSPQSRQSDMLYYVNDSPHKVTHEHSCNENKDDSFLAMMGFNKSVDEDADKSFDNRMKHDSRNNQMEREKNLNKVSTPINSKIGDFAMPSPLFPVNGTPEIVRVNNVSVKQENDKDEEVLDSKVSEDLMNQFKSCISEVADDNRNYFLHIMMLLTKQKLFLEKRLSTMTEQMDKLIENQDMLIESNRKLTLEVDFLKNKRHIF